MKTNPPRNWNIQNMDAVAECAGKLLKNTTNIYLQEEMEVFLLNRHLWMDDCRNMYLVLKRICDDGYDITDFGLWEIPHECVYTFCSIDGIRSFDVYLDHFNDSIDYTTVGFVNGHSNTEDAESIEEAVKNYYGYEK